MNLLSLAADLHRQDRDHVADGLSLARSVTAARPGLRRRLGLALIAAGSALVGAGSALAHDPRHATLRPGALAK